MIYRAIFAFYFASLYFSGVAFVYLYYVAFALNFILMLFYIVSENKFVFDKIMEKYLFFLLFCMISISWAVNPSFSKEMMYRLVLFGLNIFMVTNLLIFIKNGLGSAVFGLVVGLVLQFPLILVDDFYISGRFTGTTINPNHVSVMAILTFIAVLAWARENKWYVYNSRRVFFSKFIYTLLVLIPSVFVVVQTQSRKGLLILVLLISISLIRLTHKKVAFFSLLSPFKLGFIVLSVFLLVRLMMVLELSVLERITGALTGILDVSLINFEKDQFSGDGSTKFRLYFISLALNEFLNNPLFGRGLDNFRGIFSDNLYSHSNLFELLCTLGLFGTYAYYRFLYSISKSFYLSYSFLGLVILLMVLMYEVLMISYFERFYIIILIVISKIMGSYLTDARSSRH